MLWVGETRENRCVLHKRKQLLQKCHAKTECMKNSSRQVQFFFCGNSYTRFYLDTLFISPISELGKLFGIRIKDGIMNTAIYLNASHLVSFFYYLVNLSLIEVIVRLLYRFSIYKSIKRFNPNLSFIVQ